MSEDKKSLETANVEIITDKKAIESEKLKPVLTVTTGVGDTYHVKINQPSGRALLIAVHL